MHADKHQTFLQIDFSSLGIKVLYKVILSLLMAMIKHSQSTQSNVQNLYNIWKKKRLGMEFIFCMQINIKTPKLALLFFMEMARHVQSTQNRKLLIFFQYIKKSVTTALVFYFDAKHSDIFWGSVMFVATCWKYFFSAINSLKMLPNLFDLNKLFQHILFCNHNLWKPKFHPRWNRF